MKQNKSQSSPKKGLVLDKNISDLKPTEYTFLLNGNSSNEVESFNIQNEPSNRFGLNFQNYKVIGFRNDILKERTYYFLTNPTTRKSSIGYVDNIIVETFNNDLEQECPDCNYSNQLGEPLENTIQTPSLEYVELINDDCHIDAGREGLNFNINFPAKKIEIKQEKLGTTLYWNDNRNPKRYLNVSNIEENPASHYLITQEVPCDDDEIVGCIILDKLLVFKKHSRLQIKAETVQTGGNLKMGTYEFYAVYCDLLGNEMVNYSSPTNPISIFDENNNILSQTTADTFTNFAIKLKIENLDSEAFKYYKVVCVERNNVDNTQSAFVEGIHPTTDDTVIYTHSGSSVDDNITRGNVSIKRRIDLNSLNFVRPTYDRAKGTMVSGNRMFDYGLYKKEEINLQPVVNLFSALVEWQTSAAKQDLYKSAIATSLYKGYMRNEVQPFSIRFLMKDGDYTANFPFVGRPATSTDLEVISDINYQSINSNTPTCGIETRNKRWQIFNTASVTDTCSDITSGSTIEETVNKTCIIENVAEIPTNTVTIPITTTYEGLKDYVEDNPDVDIPGITSYIEAEYPENCSPFFGSTCDTPILTSSYNQINNVLTEVDSLIVGEEYLIEALAAGDDFSNVGYVNDGEIFIATSSTPTAWTNGTVVYNTQESIIYIEKDLVDYRRADIPKSCLPYLRDTSTGGYQRDTEFEDEFIKCNGESRRKVYFRDSDFHNENCAFADSILDNTSFGDSYFLNYAGDLVLANLLTTYDVEPATVTTEFQNKLHKKALFFSAQKLERDKFVLEITPTSKCSSDKDNLENLGLLRYTIYNSCSDFTVIGGGIIDTTVGEFIILDTTSFPNTFIIAIDSPIKLEAVENECEVFPDTTNKYKILPPCGCFSIFTRDIEYKEVEITWSKITLNKTENYSSTCLFSIPEVNECEPQPYARGIFSYWESTDTYPDNKQLYDSSNLKIKPSDLEELPTELKNKFKQYFTENGNISSAGNYILKEDTNLTCKPIRHPKFPDNLVAPFMYGSESQQEFSETIIFPLGITVDPNVVFTMLQVARLNGLITQKEFDSIEGYEILRGDNTVHKSVIANGLGFDMYKYEKEDKQEWWYSNFPFNDLGDDKFHTSDAGRNNLIKHPNNGNSNHLYTFLSPDVFLTKPSLPSEVLLTGFQLGNANQSIVDIKDHPKYTILGGDARSLAQTLAILETILETAGLLAQAGENYRVGFGLANSVNPVGVGLSIAASLAGIAGKVFQAGKYRYEWLKIFKDLGATHNFAAMTVGVGEYNRFLKNDENNLNYLRGLSVKKYLKDGIFTTVDKSNSEKININNWLREESILLSTGKNYKFNYINEYKVKDNNKLNFGLGSKMISSNIDCKTNQESARDIGSPYFSLKNYIPDQWGTIDSVKWLTTNYIFKLTEDTSCKPILGGTVYISPFSWRRKTPMFRETAMFQPSKTPFSYSEYNNIGYAKYYLDYDTGDTHRLFGVSFPDIKDNYSFDCESGRRGFYVKPPSKMYLYSHSVVNFLVESEINCHFRYAGKEQKDGFYPQISNVAEWVQEKNMSISQPNTFYYNNTYSFPVSTSPYKFLDYTYDKEIWQKRNEQPNALIYSEIDNNENSLTDPWLVYKPLNWYEFSSKFGKLIDLKDIESSQFLARFENQLVLHNAIDNLADRITPQNKEIGTGGIFASRPLEFKTTDLGFAGTQNTDICSTPYGHFYSDAKRGKFFQLDQNGKNLEIISEQIGNQPTYMKQWFREHLPFKILKAFPEIDIDNKFKGLGMNIWYDDRNSRVFVTKRDYVVKNTDCLKYSEQEGFYTNCGESFISCEEGYTYNTQTQKCEREFTTDNLCDDGYIYNSETQSCVAIEIIPAECVCIADVFATPEIICSGEATNILLTSTETGIGYNWTVTQVGVTGAASGNGNNISHTLSGAGTATYTITPYEIENGCQGEILQVTVTVIALPNVFATPSSLTISDGDTAIIDLTSDMEGTTFEWTAVSSGTSGATSGTGNTISQTITGEGTVTYTITPTNNGCEGEPVDVLVIVESTFIPCNAGMDVAFLMDYTGSMGTTINSLKTNISTIAAKIVDKSEGDYRLSLTIFDENTTIIPPRYGELTDYTSLPSDQKHIYKSTIGNELYKYITTIEKFDLNNEISFSTKLDILNTPSFPLGSGGDTPEPATYGLTRIVDFDIAGAFRPTVSKLVILATDAETNESVTGEIAAITQSCIDKGIRVMLLNVNSTTKPTLQNIATVTGGVIANGGVTQIITALDEICE